jgi:hypothetical protein
MGAAAGPDIVTDGLVLCLDAANPESYPGTGTTWSDLSRNGNNGTLTNGPTFSSDNLGSIVFDGVDDVITFSTWEDISGETGVSPITMESWFRVDDTPPNSVMGYLGFTSATNIFKFMNTTHLFLDTYNTTTSSRTLVNTILNFSNYFGQWVNVCGVSDGNSVKTYFNGNLVSTATITLGDISSLNFSIGEGMGYYRFIGNNSSCKLYNRALTASEIQQNFNALRGRYNI